MKLLWILLLCQATYSYAEDGLGYGGGLNGDDTSNAVIMPSQAAPSVPSGVRPMLQIPPDSLEPRTLVLPLLGEGKAPLVYKRDSVQALPNMQVPLPQSRVNGMAQPDAANIPDAALKKSKRSATKAAKPSAEKVPAKPAQTLDAVVY
jgi:hypothetical protein